MALSEPRLVKILTHRSFSQAKFEVDLCIHIRGSLNSSLFQENRLIQMNYRSENAVHLIVGFGQLSVSENDELGSDFESFFYCRNLTFLTSVAFLGPQKQRDLLNYENVKGPKQVK